jgi:hypothetical protein
MLEMNRSLSKITKIATSSSAASAPNGNDQFFSTDLLLQAAKSYRGGRLYNNHWDFSK